jgi:hypothetical protein
VDTRVDRHDQGVIRPGGPLPSEKVIVVTGTLQIPRTRGAVCGTLLVLLGAWGALIPFVGPYFDYAYTPAETWQYSNGRLLLEVLPGAGAALGGLLVLISANRVVAMLGGVLAALSGAWFVLGASLMSLWDGPTAGEPTGDTTQQVLEYVGFFGGLGVAIVYLAAVASGRFAVVGVREADQAREAAEAEAETEAETEPESTTEAEPVPSETVADFEDATDTQRIG